MIYKQWHYLTVLKSLEKLKNMLLGVKWVGFAFCLICWLSNAWGNSGFCLRDWQIRIIYMTNSSQNTCNSQLDLHVTIKKIAAWKSISSYKSNKCHPLFVKTQSSFANCIIIGQKFSCDFWLKTVSKFYPMQKLIATGKRGRQWNSRVNSTCDLLLT